jgi:hypothetical protein
MATSPSARVAELAELIRRYKDAYYNGQPLVSDAAYGALEDELRALEPGHSILNTIGATGPGGRDRAGDRRECVPLGVVPAPGNGRAAGRAGGASSPSQP